MALTLTGDTSNNGTELIVGFDALGHGTIDGATIVALAPAGGVEAYVGIGETATGVGDLTISADGELNLTGDQPSAQIGNHGHGDLMITGGSMSLTGDTFADVKVGANAGAQGSLTMDNGDLTLSGNGAMLVFGDHGATGTADISGQSFITVSHDDDRDSARIRLGQDSGHGSMQVDDSTLMVSGLSGRFDVGGASDSKGTGELTLTNGTLVTVEADEASAHFGNFAGSSATVDILSGSHFRVHDTDPNVEQNGFLAIGSVAGVTKATVTVDGASSQIEVDDGFINVGIDGSNGPGTGNGLLVLKNGAKVIAAGTVIGHGGTLETGNGTTEGDFLGILGGKLHLLSGGGMLHHTGGFDLREGGTMQFDVAANGATAGRYDGDGGISLADGKVAVTPVGGYHFAAGQAFTLATADLGVGFENSFGADDVSVAGQGSNFGFAFGTTGNSLVLKALNAGGSSKAAVLDFGAAEDNDAVFDYSTTSASGAGKGGVFTQMFARNVDEVRGTKNHDEFTVTGKGALTLKGVGGDDDLTGGTGKNKLMGGDGNDHLIGGGGGDKFTGGAGADELTGGTDDSKDVFIYSDEGDSGKKKASDHIFNFDPAKGKEKVSDKINLSQLDADKDQKHDQDFRFVDHFTKPVGKEPAGEVMLQDAGKNIKVLVDLDGDKHADMVFVVMHVAHLHEKDFIL